MAAAPELIKTLPEISIRPMEDFDVQAVVDVERASYQFPWSDGIFRDCLRVGYLCRVVEVSGVVMGHGILSVGAGEGHVLNLCVRESVRCRGIGRRLLSYLMDAARGSGAQEVFLEVRPSNTTAIRLYQAAGFTQIGVRRAYYQAVGGREDAVVLRLRLGSASANESHRNS
jgi:ribosomal-protein-alanine N-acetyltransferase